MLESTLPNKTETIAKWRRPNRGTQLKLPKRYVMALLYMLHIEHFRSRHASKRPVINRALLDVLLSFDKWVKCPCGKCGCLWNFASTNWGWYRNHDTSEATRKCPLYKRARELEQHRSDEAWTASRTPKEISEGEKLRDKCYKIWYQAGDSRLQSPETSKGWAIQKLLRGTRKWMRPKTVTAVKTQMQVWILHEIPLSFRYMEARFLIEPAESAKNKKLMMKFHYDLSSLPRQGSGRRRRYS